MTLIRYFRNEEKKSDASFISQSSVGQLLRPIFFFSFFCLFKRLRHESRPHESRYQPAKTAVLLRPRSPIEWRFAGRKRRRTAVFAGYLATDFRSVLKWQMSDRFESDSSISYFAPMFDIFTTYKVQCSPMKKVT